MMASSVSKYVKTFDLRTSPRKGHFILSLNEVVHCTKLHLGNPDDHVSSESTIPRSIYLSNILIAKLGWIHSGKMFV